MLLLTASSLIFLFHYPRDHPHLHSFPTRRSSDLVLARLFLERGVRLERTSQLNVGGNTDFLNMLERSRLESKKISKTNRSEEHTSELQSRFDLVCRLLLEKKKNIKERVPWLINML